MGTLFELREWEDEGVIGRERAQAGVVSDGKEGLGTERAVVLTGRGWIESIGCRGGSNHPNAPRTSKAQRPAKEGWKHVQGVVVA